MPKNKQSTAAASTKRSTRSAGPAANSESPASAAPVTPAKRPCADSAGDTDTMANTKKNQAAAKETGLGIQTGQSKAGALKVKPKPKAKPKPKPNTKGSKTDSAVP